MINQIENHENTTGKRTIAGVIITVIGAALLLSETNLVHLAPWVISWPMVLIGFGLYTGFKHDFKKPMWFVYTIIGVAFLLPNIIPSFSIHLLWPLLIIAFGIRMITRRNQQWNGERWEIRNGSYGAVDNNIE